MNACRRLLGFLPFFVASLVVSCGRSGITFPETEDEFGDASVLPDEASFPDSPLGDGFARLDVGIAGDTGVLCTTGTVCSSGACVDTTSDPANCGGCGVLCADNQVCSESSCQSGCAPGLTNCDGACVNLATNSSHCGTCSTGCAVFLQCAGG